MAPFFRYNFRHFYCALPTTGISIKFVKRHQDHQQRDSPNQCLCRQEDAWPHCLSKAMNCWVWKVSIFKMGKPNRSKKPNLASPCSLLPEYLWWDDAAALDLKPPFPSSTLNHDPQISEVSHHSEDTLVVKSPDRWCHCGPIKNQESAKRI